jgi:hypothetical protein
MYVLMLSPGYPVEIPYFTRALACAGARVLGVSDQPESNLPREAPENLAGYLPYRTRTRSSRRSGVGLLR